MLQDQFSESIQAEAPEQEAKSGDHGHDSEISRRKQPCQDDYRPDLQSEVSHLTSNARPDATNGAPAKSLARGDRVKIAIGIERSQLSFPEQWRMVCELSGEVVRRVPRCDRFNIRSHARRCDNREDQKDPDEIQNPKSSLGNAVDSAGCYVG